MTQTESNFDQQKSAQFANQLLDTINKAGIALMTSIGHQTGLFDTMAGLPPATSERIAKAANGLAQWSRGASLSTTWQKKRICCRPNTRRF
jgi:hypothetical protein